MSAAVEKKNDDTMMLCASCGTAGGEDIKLKKCTACYLVRYCSVKCQKEHRPKHKKECRKRAAELRDELLFKQPECYLGDCPICCLPVPLGKGKTILYPCCSKLICKGCTYANMKQEILGRLEHKCPFCRKDKPKTDEEADEQLQKRIEANDPIAICDEGTRKCEEGDYKAAYEYWTRAVALGDVNAHYQLSCVYRDGKGVEKDEKRALHHAEKAAIAGHPEARQYLGWKDRKRGSFDRAAKHYIIAANLGDEVSLKGVKDLYRAGFVSKEVFAAALRGHKAAIDETKSPQREEAAEYYKQFGIRK